MSQAKIAQFGATAILMRVLRASASDRIALTSAGCAFYAMLALFPGIFLLISLYGMVFDAAAVEPQLEVLRELVPEDTFEMIATRVHDLVEAPRPRLDSRLRRRRRGSRRRHAGVGVVGAPGRPRRNRHADLHADNRRDVHR
jgi:membrane protein